MVHPLLTYQKSSAMLLKSISPPIKQGLQLKERQWTSSNCMAPMISIKAYKTTTNHGWLFEKDDMREINLPKNIEHKYELEFKCTIAYPSTRVATVGARFQDHEKRPHSSDRHICKHRSHQNSFKHHLVIDPPYALWKSMVCGVMVSLLRRQWSITWRQTGILRGTYALSSFLLSTPGVTPPSQRNFAHSWMWDRPVTCEDTSAQMTGT